MVDENDPDAPLKDVWELRCRALAQFGNDRDRYFRHLAEIQDSPELRDLVIPKEKLARGRKKPAA